MTHSQRPANQILVMGDLCLDVLIHGINSSQLTQFGHVSESAVRSSSKLSVGGSAWLLAHAAMATGLFYPVIVSAVGDDMWAHDLLSSTREAGLLDHSIQQIESASTDLVCMITLEGQKRVMFMPEEPTNNRLEEDFVLAFLHNTDPQFVKWTWLSGYTLADQYSARSRSAKLLADWSRENKIPVVLDLVPHKFRALVGTLDEVSGYMGTPDVLIGAPSTFQELGYAYEVHSDDDIVKHMTDVAVEASRHWGIVITQAWITPEKFGQAVARRGVILFIDELTISVRGARGIGDRLAVEALHRLDSIP